MQTNNESLIKIASILNEHEYFDGTFLGEKLNITRAAVWKNVQKLQEYGIPIHSAKGKGYMLEEPLILLDSKKIKKQLDDKSVLLEIFEKLASTNDHLKNRSKLTKPIVCMSETQTQGKGRLGRTWHSPFGKNIYLSLAYPFKKDLSELSGLSLIAGLAICNAIDHCIELPEPALVKWPNDIMINKKKVGGILIEISAEAHGQCRVIIGVGLNANLLNANKKSIPQAWTSLQKESGAYVDRNTLAASVIDQLLVYLKRFSEMGLSDFEKEWESKDCLFGQAVQLSAHGEQFSGIGAGINEHGHLLIKTQDGSTQAFALGDATLSR